VREREGGWQPANLSCPDVLPVGEGREAGGRLEMPREGAVVVEAAGVRNVRHGVVAVAQALRGGLEARLQA